MTAETAKPDMSGVTCMLCSPPEVVGEGLMDHLRLFHPDMHETIAAAVAGDLARPAAPDPAPGTQTGGREVDHAI